MIGLVNLGNSNIQSLMNALDYLKIDYFVTDNSKKLVECDKIILPGVGTFGNGISKLLELNLFKTIKNEVIHKNKPILGICLGMQLLFEKSEESKNSKGLGLLQGEIVKLPKSSNYNIPRIGWAESQISSDFLGLQAGETSDFYYIHSFFAKPGNKKVISIETDGILTAAVQYKNIYGCQFHPEKSHLNGLKIIETFSKLGNK